jgi:ribonuclease R
MVNLLLRSLEKARYLSTEALHYALGWTHYTHFTSPIRRYADTRVHQILTAALAGRRDEAVSVDLPEVCVRISAREVQAEEAERELSKVKILRLLAAKAGEVVRGRVSAVVEAGAFVEILGFYVEGLLPGEALGRDEYLPTQDGLALVGQKSGRRIKLGDELSVRINLVDLARRRLDLTLP